MRLRLHLLLIVLFAWIGSAIVDGFLVSKQACAQTPSGSSRSDSGSRGRFGDRVRGDWRSKSSRKDDEHRGDEKRGDERPSGSDSSSTTSSSTGTSSQTTSSTNPAPSTTTATPSASGASNLGLKKWATDLVAKNDKNGDMILQPDEQRFLGSSAASEDLNHDGMITIDELVMHKAGGATPAGPPAAGAVSTAPTSGDSGRSGDRGREHGRHDGGSGSDNRSKTDDPMAKRVLTGTAGGTGKDADKRHSYRFSRPSDKLPTSLPPWFKSRDTNGDAQVSMSEYSRSVSQSMVSEFRRYDANDDGMITAKEAAKRK